MESKPTERRVNSMAFGYQSPLSQQNTNPYLIPPIGFELSELEREVVRIALNEYRFALSHRLNMAPDGHRPPDLMALTFFDAIAAGLMARLKGGFTLVEEHQQPKPPIDRDVIYPVQNRSTAAEQEAQPVAVNETSTVAAE